MTVDVVGAGGVLRDDQLLALGTNKWPHILFVR